MSHSFGNTITVDDLAMRLLHQASCSYPLENIYCQTIMIECLKCGKMLTIEEYKVVWDRDQPHSVAKLKA